MNDACGWVVIELESVGSTNDYLKERLHGLHDRTVVTARRQTAGRGRLGRTWASPPGGLYASLLLKPPPVPELAQRVSLLAAGILCGIM
ncbi:MAG: biotin--[acetyl-CoA-carboxylase] ligase, partial [Candidatus Fermentibacter daniensis]|nr:biotin--[acetyl-CoA-carboxylase] ligase [Candidatus Fermentibacter daniensis]